MCRIKILLLGLVVALGTTLCVTSATLATSSDPKDSVCQGIGATYSNGSCQVSQGKDLASIVKTILNIFSWVVGMVSVMFAVYAGFRYVTSGGDSNKVKSAKDTLLYVVVGLIVVALSQVIVNFVLVKSNESISVSEPNPSYQKNFEYV